MNKKWMAKKILSSFLIVILIVCCLLILPACKESADKSASDMTAEPEAKQDFL